MTGAFCLTTAPVDINNALDYLGLHEHAAVCNGA